MPTQYTTSIFSNSYRDDFRESDGYARILFNGGRALQRRELTQLQTIIQKQIERFGRNIFKEGAAVNPGGLTVNNSYEFIKLAAGSVLPSPITTLVGTTFTGQSSGVKVVVLEVVDTENSDPPTLYVRYTDTSSGTSGASPIRMSPSETIDNGTYSYSVQAVNTSANPAVGKGTRVSIAGGDFFTQGFFVFSPPQSKIISKYSSTPSNDVGFRVIQDIVTVSDTNDLYDNSNDTPNFSAPGADRFRIRLIAATRDELDSDQSFVYVAKIIDGVLVDEVQGNEDYNKINDVLALRTKEESGNYNVKPFKIRFEENDSDPSVLDLKISDGTSYIDGYRASLDYPSVIQVPKAQDTVTINNEVVAATFGNFVIGSNGFGVPNINELEQHNIRSATSYGGSTIGTCRVRAVEEDGSNYRYYLFDIQMNAGQSFRSGRSIGTGATSYFDLSLEAGQAVLKEAGRNNLLFRLPTNRPKSLSDISLTVQRRFLTTTDGSGQATINLTAPGETFANTTDWIVANADSAIDLGVSISGSGTASAVISNGPASSANFEILAYVNKSQGVSRTKTLTETTKTGTIESDGSGLKFLSLGFADVYDVSRVRLTDSNGADISNRFVLDNGQRDNFYGIGRLVLSGGQTPPAGNVFARYRYFSHGTSGDFFSVNSYTGQVNYADIPSHRLANGEVVSLRDILDFRPIKDYGTSGFGSGLARVNELPQNTDLITSDVVYYQPRYSRLVIDINSKLNVISGPSSLTPILPEVPVNTLNLYNIKLNAFTLNDSDMAIEKVENKRYTMADIGRLETRVDNLEEVTALSLLELDTANFDVLDSTGANRTKSGFLVDNFKDHFFADETSPEYSASIDPDARVLRPGFWAENVSLVYDSDASSNVILKGDNVYLKYGHTVQINQNLATSTENINPFAVITNQGFLTISPASDDWTEQRRVAARAVNDPNVRISNQLDLNWNNWQWNWAGREIPATGVDRTQTLGRGRRTTIPATSSIRETVGDRVVDVTLIPFMRSIKIFFKVEGMKPNTRVFPFFDGRNVSKWCRAEAFQTTATSVTDFGNTQINATEHPEGQSTLITDAEGKLEGSFFVPNTAADNFRTGSREFKFLDITVDDESGSTSIAKSIFVSSGLLETLEVPSTRPTPTRRPARNGIFGAFLGALFFIDPMAQSFKVDTLNGMFLTKVDIFFASKDSTVPVQIQIRPMVNGIPSSDQIVPGSVKFLSPASVNTSADASVATTFEFDEPIYLAPLTDYAIVLLAESVEYNVYVAETNQFLLGSTERRVTKQPTLGSLFKSQNASTWEPDQTKDLMFRTYRANFLHSSGSVALNNADIPNRILEANPIIADSGSSTIRIIQPNHGFTVGDNVKISGVDSASTIGGISGTSILGTRAVTAVDYSGYNVVADSSATSNEIGGGSNVLASQNIMYDVLVPSISSLVPTATTTSLTGKFTTGKSFAGTETPYQKDASYSDIYVNENNVFNAPRIIANSTIQASELGAGVKSADIKVDISSTSSQVSPIIDLQRCSLFLINNVIDNQDSAATVGFNVPLSFVAETDPAAGSSASKHVTSPVTLEASAVGLKVLISANRPSVSDFDVYYRVAADGDNLSTTSWVIAQREGTVPSDENSSIYRDYEYLIGGQGGNLSPFTEFQIKIVFNSTNSSKVPVLKDLRVIALSV